VEASAVVQRRWLDLREYWGPKRTLGDAELIACSAASRAVWRKMETFIKQVEGRSTEKALGHVIVFEPYADVELWANAVAQRLAGYGARLYDLNVCGQHERIVEDVTSNNAEVVVLIAIPDDSMQEIESTIAEKGCRRLWFMPELWRRKRWLYPTYCGVDMQSIRKLAPVWRHREDWNYFVRRRLALRLQELTGEAFADGDLDPEKLSAWIDEDDVKRVSPSVNEFNSIDDLDEGIADFIGKLLKQAIKTSGSSGGLVVEAEEPGPKTGETRRQRTAAPCVSVGLIKLPKNSDRPPNLSASVYDIRNRRNLAGRTAQRLWVEGETDKAFLDIGADHVLKASGEDLLDGFEIVPAGKGRAGGTSALTERLRNAEICRASDIVLIDDDPDGRKLLEDLKHLDIMHVVVPRDAIPSYLDDNVEIEDLILLDARDRFYMSNQSRQPEREILYFSSAASRVDARRIVISGPDKAAFVTWLQEHSTYDDLRGIINLAHEVRDRFGLPALKDAPLNRRDWLPPFRDRNLVGLRRRPWLQYSMENL